MESQNLNQEAIQNFIETLRAFYQRIEMLNFKFPEELEKLIIDAFEPIKVHNLQVKRIFPTIERITVNKRVIGTNTRIFEERKLKYPPAEYVKKYGRANIKYQSVFYGTFNFMTAIKEMNPEIGDLITVSRWKLKNENDLLVVCPMFLNQPNDGSTNYRLKTLYNWFIQELKKYPPLISNSYFELHQFYSNCFAREIDSKDNQGYLITALLADKILNKYKNGIVDAILYPSTKEDLRTENIAIKKESFDAKYQLSETTEKRLLKIANNGDRYEFERLGESLRIDGNEIKWK
jgi:hypothetical protein